ncbi:hypothetical protein [Fibrella forsythiae]|uniref:hypothetical protein n=1 Tax=Fibrella forsythiae TaxID=2817061 RepID=UPI001E4B4B30|nr:hypothetical protein [Fibrella forsythiae]
MALTNKAIKPLVALEQPTRQTLTQRPLGARKGSFELANYFTGPLDDLSDYI